MQGRRYQKPYKHRTQTVSLVISLNITHRGDFSILMQSVF